MVVMASNRRPVPAPRVVVIGAGVAGIYQLYRLLEVGADALVLEAADDLGGTWYRNRYPGCRFDSESYTYGYSFSEELLDEWDWSEHFAAQPETLRYLNHVADRFELREHMRFDCRVDAATYDDDTRTWTLELADGRALRCRFLITAIGVLSAPTMPRIEGIDRFEGRSFHTYDWPHEPRRPRRQAGGRDRHRRHRRAAASPRSPTRSPSCTCSSAAPTGARRCTTARSRPRRWRRSRLLRRHLRAAPRHPAASSTSPTGGKSFEVPEEERLRVLRGAVRLPRLPHLAGQLPRGADGRGGQRRVHRVRRQQDPGAGERPRHRRAS